MPGRKEKYKYEVYFENLQDAIPVGEDLVKLLEKAVQQSLKLAGIEYDCEVDVTLVDLQRIRELNLEFRGIDRETDVLSFPVVDMKEGSIVTTLGDFDVAKKLLLLGDIVICPQKALIQAEEYLHSFEREMAFLTTHGTFHLLGYDHEDEEQEKNMLDAQEEVLAVLGLERA